MEKSWRVISFLSVPTNENIHYSSFASYLNPEIDTLVVDD